MNGNIKNSGEFCSANNWRVFEVEKIYRTRVLRKVDYRWKNQLKNDDKSKKNQKKSSRKIDQIQILQTRYRCIYLLNQTAYKKGIKPSQFFCCEKKITFKHATFT
jgi:hypothetical protein